MDLKELMYALALQETKGVGAITAKKLIAIYGSAVNVFMARQKNKIEKDVNVELFKRLFTKGSLLKSENEINKAISKGLKCLYYKDKEYPKYLLQCSDSPLVLFQDGNINFNQFSKIISIVGTRNMSSYGRVFCEDLIVALKKHQPLIVSGYAFGVDICAHLQALKNEITTTAVLAHGYGTVYPNEHKRFYQDVKESGGFLSEFTYDEKPLRGNFLKRNRIVAGISQATIVIESAAKGGSLVTADIANSYNKDVFALPGRANDTYSKGCNGLIKNHKAAMITTAQDLIEQLGWEQPNSSQSKIIQPQLFVDLEGEEKQVYDLLASNALYADELARTLAMPIYKISNIIFQLEMKGLIEVLPGKLIKRG